MGRDYDDCDRDYDWGQVVLGIIVLIILLCVIGYVAHHYLDQQYTSIVTFVLVGVFLMLIFGGLCWNGWWGNKKKHDC